MAEEADAEVVDEHPQPDFFVSYTELDRAWAEWISRVLEEAGYRVVVQSWDFGAGNFVAEMERAVKTARWVLPVLSEAYLTSKYGTAEWTAFIGEPSTVIPIQIEDLESRSMLRTQVRINLRGLAEAEAADRLRSHITDLAEPPAHPPRSRNPARFPGVVVQIAPDTADRMLIRDLPAQRIAASRVALVILGSGEADRAAAAALPSLFDVVRERTHDLYDSELDAAKQLTEVAEILDDLDDNVSDVIVVAVGEGRNVPDTGICLHVRTTDPGQMLTSIGLRSLLEKLTPQLVNRRVHLLLDVTDKDGAAVGPSTSWEIPVLDLRNPSDGAGPAGGLLGLCAALTSSPSELMRRLGHWSPLALTDLAMLSGGTLVAPEWAGAAVGLAPNPLAWPQEPPRTGSNWCFVLSTTDAQRTDKTIAHTVDLLERYRQGRLDSALRAVNSALTLDEVAARCHAAEVFSAPAAFARAVDQVCRAEIAVFDVTNYEPAVMILLGIRAVIRRGVTLCVHGEHHDYWNQVGPPFHLREISLLANPSFGTVGNRLLAGITQLSKPGRTYCDLPSFDLVRSVPPEQDRRGPRPFDQGPDPSMLALVPFDPEYTARNWSELAQNLPEAAVAMRPDPFENDAQPPRLRRTLDLDSPRVVSAQLYEAMRLTDFCLVDITGARPNVMFELGVRLAANALHPVVVYDAAFTTADSNPNADVIAQRDQLCGLLAAVPYTPYADGEIDSYEQMVARHLELRSLATRAGHPRAQTVLDGFPPGGVYDLAWRYAAQRDEAIATPVAEHLIAAANTMLVDPSDGARRLIYPKRHDLSTVAEEGGRERLVAAWLYLHHRRQDYRDDNREVVAAYEALTDRLIEQLESTGDDGDSAFAEQIDRWRADADAPGDGSEGRICP